MEELFASIIDNINYYMWTYILIALLLGCAVYFSIRTGLVQFRMIGEMFRTLGESTSKEKGKKQISSFQAFAVSLASRVGTGNLAGVATALVVGGPGAIFWMWVVALLGSASSFVESTLAQLYKTKNGDSYIGGPAYYMQKGLKKKWLGVLFAVLISITFGFAFNTVQSNTICAAMQASFSIEPYIIGIILTALTLLVVFGGINRIALVSSILVPIMALGYIILALVIVILNISHLPDVLSLIIDNAFGFEQALGGTIGVALMQGIKRGLFSNEAGMGSAPNVAATASVSHPVKQGLIQTLGVFVDTLLICTCTAFIILFNIGSIDPNANGIEVTQQALTASIGPAGGYFITIAILLFAFSSIIGNYYYGETNIRFITGKKWILQSYRLVVGAMVMIGALLSLDLVWSFADVTMGLMTICNLVAITLLGKKAFLLLKDYRSQKARGVKEPQFCKGKIPEFKDEDIECW